MPPFLLLFETDVNRRRNRVVANVDRNSKFIEQLYTVYFDDGTKYGTPVNGCLHRPKCESRLKSLKAENKQTISLLCDVSSNVIILPIGNIGRSRELDKFQKSSGLADLYFKFIGLSMMIPAADSNSVLKALAQNVGGMGRGILQALLYHMP